MTVRREVSAFLFEQLKKYTEESAKQLELRGYPASVNLYRAAMPLLNKEYATAEERYRGVQEVTKFANLTLNQLTSGNPYYDHERIDTILSAAILVARSDYTLMLAQSMPEVPA